MAVSGVNNQQKKSKQDTFLEDFFPVDFIDTDGTYLNKIGSLVIPFRMSLPSVGFLTKSQFGNVEDRSGSKFKEIQKGDYGIILDKLQILFNMLPMYSSIHIQHIFYETTLKSENMKREKPMSEFRKAFFEEMQSKGYQDHQSYIFFTLGSATTFSKERKDISVYGDPFRGKPTRNTLNKNVDEGIRESFYNLISYAETTFNDSFFSLKHLSTEEVLAYFKKYISLNFNEPTEEEKAYEGSNFELLNDKDSMKLGNNYVDIYALENLESFKNVYHNHSEIDLLKETMFESYTSLFPLFFDIEGNHIVNISFVGQNDFDITTSAYTKNRKLVAFEKYSLEKGKTRKDSDELEKGKAQCYSDYVGSLNKENKPLLCNLNILFWEDIYKPEEFYKKNRKKMLTIQSYLPFSLSRITYYRLVYYFLNVGGCSEMMTKKDCFFSITSKSAPFLFPVETSISTRLKSQEDGYGLQVRDKKTGKSFFYDVLVNPYANSKTTNRNWLMFGESGSGKSVTAFLLVEALLDMMGHVVIIDMGDSYKLLSLIYKDISLYYQFSYNNFVSYRAVPSYNFIVETANLIGADEDEEGEESTPEQRIQKHFNNVKKNVVSLLCNMIPIGIGNEVENESALFQMVSIYYEENLENDNVSFDGLLAFIEMIKNKAESDDKEYFRSKQRMIELFKLFPFTSFFIQANNFKNGERYGTMLNGQETNRMFFDYPLIIFEIDKIKDDKLLSSIALWVVTNIYVEKLYKMKFMKFKELELYKEARNIPLVTTFIIDEAWKMLLNPMMNNFILWVEKTCRKHAGSTGMVTQEVADLKKCEEIMAAIISNSANKFLLQMSEDLELITKLFKLNEKEVKMLESLNKKSNGEATGIPEKDLFIKIGNQIPFVLQIHLADQQLIFAKDNNDPRKKILLRLFSKMDEHGGYKATFAKYLEELKKLY